MKKVEFKLPSTAWGFPIASARFFTFHYSLFTKRRKLTRLWLVRHFQNLSRIESWCDGFVLSRIFIVLLDFSAPVGRWDCHGLSLTGGILRRTGANTIRKKSNIKWQRKIKWNPWKDKIRRIGVLSVNSLSACGLSRRRRSTTMWYCLPDNSLLLSYKSRDFVPGYSRSARYCLPDKITRYYYASSRPSIVII